MTSSSRGEGVVSARETRVFVARVRQVLQQLAVLVRNAYFHDLSNRVFTEPLENLLASLGEMAAEEGSLRIERVGQELFANGVRIRMEIRGTPAYKLVCEELEKRDLGGLELETGVLEKEVRGLLTLLIALDGGGEDSADRFNAQLSAGGVEHIRVFPPRAESSLATGEGQSDRRARALRVYQEALDFIKRCITELESPLQVSQRQAKRVVHRLVDMSYEDGDGFSMLGLASIKDHDHYTFNHMVNVCLLAIAFGNRLGLSRGDLADLGLCALYHDMGKVHIPTEVLNKPGKFNAEEWALMGSHTVFGARALLPLLAQDNGVLRRVLVALQHHYGYAGHGYPKLRVLTRQILYARIVAIVDLFDAMTSKRVYQEEFLPDAALRRMLELAGEYCDPVLTKAFINCMGIFPVGSTVRLEGGEVAVVIEANPDPDRLDRPKLRMVMDGSRRPLEPEVKDLARPEEGGLRIVECVDPEPLGINSAHFAL